MCIRDRLIYRARGTTEKSRMSRILQSLRYPLSKLSPASQKTRINKTATERKNLAQKLKKVQSLNCEVHEKQHMLNCFSLYPRYKQKDRKLFLSLLNVATMYLVRITSFRDVWNLDVVERLEQERDQNQVCQRTHIRAIV